MTDPLFIAVTPLTHAAFVDRQDAADVGSDALMRQLLEVCRDRCRRCAAA